MKKMLLLLAVFSLGMVLSLPLSARAAISFSSCGSSAGGNGGDLTLNFTAQQDDLVVVAYAVGDNDSTALNLAMVTAGYTEPFTDIDNTADTQDVYLGVFYKFMGATPDTSAVVDGLGGTDAGVAAICMIFRGVDTTTPMDVTPTTTLAINTGIPDPPSIDHNNPSGVWTVAVGASGNLASSGTMTPPANYNDDALGGAFGDDTGGDVLLDMAYRSDPADPENPGTFTPSYTDSANYAWIGATLALRPAAVSKPTVTTDAETNVNSSRATLNGTVSATGGENATVRGFAWGTNSTLSGGDTSTTTESGDFGTGAFSQIVSTLKANTTYYFRAYATNSAGTGYGSTIDNFTTSAADTTPSRKMRLFQGFTIKLIDNRLKLLQQ